MYGYCIQIQKCVFFLLRDMCDVDLQLPVRPTRRAVSRAVPSLTFPSATGANPVREILRTSGPGPYAPQPAPTPAAANPPPPPPPGTSKSH